MAKHGPETQQEGLSQQAPAAASSPCYSAIVARLCSTLGWLISIIFITLIALSLWLCSPAPQVLASRTQQCPPATHHTPENRIQSLCRPLQLLTTLSAAKASSRATLLPDSSGETSDFCQSFYSRENRQSYQRTETASVELMNPALRVLEEGTVGAACPETGHTRNQLIAGDFRFCWNSMLRLQSFLVKPVN